MQLAKIRILCLEDDENMGLVLAYLLRNSGYDVVVAQNLALVLNLAQASTFNLYLVDGGIPEQSGLEICQTIRLVDTGTPILLISAVLSEQYNNEVLEAGVQKCLTKPVDPEELDRAVGQLIGKSLN